ncbi:hypothetical protein [Vulgatibacter sp.]|uniref:hypothetical protein n=1 Tax=Vulgatibacter sp. TaxID=1971226 RepID=UPI003561D553
MADAIIEREREAFAGTVLREGLIGGLLAGAVFALAEMLVSAAMGGSIFGPWAMFASILLGSSALSAEFTLGIFIVGFVVHFVLSALFGLIWGATAKSVSRGIRDSWGAHAVAAMIYGLVIWLVNFQVIARVVYPWFLQTNALAQILLHALAFGLPLGLYLTARLRPIEGAAGVRRTVV